MVDRSEQSVGTRVRQRRQELGLTQEDLARRARVSLNVIRNVENGRTTSPYRLPDIYRALGIPMETTAIDLADEVSRALNGQPPTEREVAEIRRVLDEIQQRRRRADT